MKFFSFDPNGDGFQFHDTAEEAREVAENALACESDVASDGWDESMEAICWGKVMGSVVEVSREENPESPGDDVVDYQMRPIED